MTVEASRAARVIAGLAALGFAASRITQGTPHRVARVPTRRAIKAAFAIFDAGGARQQAEMIVRSASSAWRGAARRASRELNAADQ